ncbi:MAG: translation initiation factor IF-2 [Lachnospiraceae bacterium]|nr:translation initiation factor IF-2 [Lachnospiraceae bacterium]
MGKIQVLKLTKELKDKGIDITNKDIVGFLNEKGVSVTNHMSSIEESQAEMVRENFEKKTTVSGEKAIAAEKDGGVQRTASVEKAKSSEKSSSTDKTGNAGDMASGEKSKGSEKAGGQKQGRSEEGKKSEGQKTPKKKKHIIVATNNNVSRGNSGRYNNSNNSGGGRQIVSIRNGKIEQPKTRKPFKHTEVASPEALGLKRDNSVETELPVQNKPAEGNTVEEKAVSKDTQQNVAETKASVQDKAVNKDKTAPEKAAAEKSAEKPAAEKPVAEKSASEKSASDKPASEKPQSGKSSQEKKSAPASDSKKAGSSSETKKEPERKIFGNVYANMANNNNNNSGRQANTAKGGRTSTGGSVRSGNGQGRSNYGNRETQGRTGRSFGSNQGNFNRNGSFPQTGGHAAGGGGGRSGVQRGGQRQGSFAANQGGRGSFESSAPAKGQQGRRSDADRRRQSEARRRKDAALEASLEENQKSRKFNPHGFHKPAPVEKPKEEEIKVISLPDEIAVCDLAEKMKIQSAAIVKKLFLEGRVVTPNSELTYEEAENIAAEYDILCEHEEKIDVIAELLKEEEEDEGNMRKRPPVVCVMGHVDHGKTSLLDKIRSTHVTEKESGGITQAIGAYMVGIKGQKITFLDTPGHEAFTAMRMRGANATDIAVLVVAADDGVMPQTIEAINHAKAAGVEIIVAINKIDKPEANIDRVKQALSEYELIPEEWGGSTVFVPVSAKTGEGIDQLLEMILLSADIMELKADPNRQARGLVIEARLDKGRGPCTTILVQKGTLRVGDFVAAGSCHGRVRAMLDEHGKRIKEATPSTPAEILGLDDVPEAGDIFVSPETDKEAKSFAETFKSQHKRDMLSENKQRMSLDDLYSQIKEGDLKEFNVIIKADVQGSVEALKSSLLKISNEEVALKVIHGGVGAINESDVSLASASNAIIIGFNVKPDVMAKSSADRQNVDIRLYKVIYQAIDEVENAMKGMLAPVYEEKIIGHVEIRQIFKASQIGSIAGSYVTDGTVERGCSCRITRDGEQIFEGKLASLKRFKDDVKEVREGYECGLVFDGFNDLKELDQVECYKMVEVART